MTETEQINKAIEFARKAHDGQYRRDGVTPYFNHLESVAKRVERHGHKAVIVAYLHDIIENCNVTIKDLWDLGFDSDVIIAVDLLTIKPHIKYEDYLTKLKSFNLALQVKVADMISNLSDDPTDAQIKKYAKGLNFLLNV